MTTAAEITLREQQLDDEGHDENCPVFSDGDCAGEPVCMAGTAERARPRIVRSKAKAATATESVTLTGASAAAYRRYVTAMAELRTTKEMFATAGAVAQAAHEEFLRLVVGQPP